MENCTLEINPETSAQIAALKEEIAELRRLLQQK
jgi:hypothetical protein